MNIAVCDDERECIEDITKHLNLYFSERGLSYELYEYDNSNDILNSDTDFDIAVLDIEMDGEDGIQVGKKLQKINPDIALMYVTAYNHYLDDAMDLGSVRFFNKPIESSRFYYGLDRSIEKVNNAGKKIFLDDGSGRVYVRANDIVYVEIKGRKTKVVTKDNEYMSGKNMKYWVENLKESYFEQVHKSFIINTDFITYFCRDYVIMNEKDNVPIAYSKRGEFKRKFMMLLGD